MTEQIIILLVFVVFVLVNLVAGFLTRRRERQATDEETAPLPPAPRVPRAAPRFVPELPPVDVAPPAPPAHRRRRAMLGRTDLRHAIVLMTVLGAPRALADEARDLPR